MIRLLLANPLIYLYIFIAGYAFHCGLVEYFNMEPIISILIASAVVTIGWIIPITDPLFFIVIPGVWGSCVAWEWNIFASIAFFVLTPIIFLFLFARSR